MKNIQDFEKLININFLEDFNTYGFYPFLMFVEYQDGITELNALALGGNVLECYKIFGRAVHKKAKKVYLALDFEKSGDIEHDYVAIFCYENGKYKLHALPFDIKTGEIKDKIFENERLSKILGDLKYVINRMS